MPSPTQTVPSYLRLFPEADTVFTPDQSWLAPHFSALMSVDLSVVDPAWQGWIHVLNPIETMDGYVGEHGGLSNTYVGPNWLAFRLEEGGRYRFLGERGYFQLEAPLIETHPVRARREQEARAQLAEYYQVQQAQFSATRSRWLSHGFLDWAHHDDPMRPRREHLREQYDEQLALDGEDNPLVEQVGGVTGYGNWTESPPIPSAFTLDTTDTENVYPRCRDGRPFRLVAVVAGYPWREEGADGIVVFFEPETRTVLMTFDWS